MQTGHATIMIVTYNRLALTKLTLKSLFKTTQYPFSLVIVDNGSKDGTVEYLETYLEQEQKSQEFCTKYTIIPNAQNYGIGIGRNQALLAADGEWLVTLDNDVLLPHDWLTKCIEILSKNPEVGACGVNFEHIAYPLVKRNETEYALKPDGNLGTACMVFHRKLFTELGFFNTEYGLYGEEDADFGYRARITKHELAYLVQEGVHLGEGENDVGEYRTFKDNRHKKNLLRYRINAYLYRYGIKSTRIRSPHIPRSQK